MSAISRALIPCGGKGTRMQSISGDLAKEMLLIGGIPVVELVARECAASGITDLLVVVAPGKESIVQHLAHRAGTPHMPSRIEFAIQNEPRGLADAIRLGRDFADNGAIAVALPDNLFLAERPALGQLLDVAERAEKSVVAIVKITAAEAKSRGATAVYSGMPLDVENVFKITSIPDKGAKSATFDTVGAEAAYTGVGRYAFTSEVWAAIDKVERTLLEGAELDDIPVMQRLLAADRLTGCLI